MTDINDDLLPGDEDAILDDLAKNDRTAIAAEAIKKQLAHFLQQEDFMARVKGLDFASGGIFNRDTTMPFIPMDRDEAVVPLDHKISAYGYGMQVVHPKHSTIITNVGC
ncbi:MAG TPA: hypothetical protein H9899_06970 [Candidatus Sphingomonas excrementigallinarum]|nr:hypothetical protein [Candidatus Sphingomonas excrementigallinarum]